MIIELEDIVRGKILINPQHIVSVTDNGQSRFVSTVVDGFKVNETYDEIHRILSMAVV